MKYRRILAALSALSLMMAVCSCGKDDTKDKSDTSDISVTEEAADGENDSKSR